MPRNVQLKRNDGLGSRAVFLQAELLHWTQANVHLPKIKHWQLYLASKSYNLCTCFSKAIFCTWKTASLNWLQEIRMPVFVLSYETGVSFQPGFLARERKGSGKVGMHTATQLACEVCCEMHNKGVHWCTASMSALNSLLEVTEKTQEKTTISALCLKTHFYFTGFVSVMLSW